MSSKPSSISAALSRSAAGNAGIDASIAASSARPSQGRSQSASAGARRPGENYVFARQAMEDRDTPLDELAKTYFAK
jgi:hypothetical protein